MPFSIERNDLARMHVDAIVVAANEQLQITGGVGAEVAKAAGFDFVQRACDEIGYCPTGSAVATPGFGLHAATIVHAVGPVWQGGGHGEEALLRSAYYSALQCANDAGALSVALPLISAGTYKVPAELSFSIAMEAIRAFLSAHDLDVKLVLYNRTAVIAAMPLFGEIAEYIDDNYVDAHRDDELRQYQRYEAAAAQMPIIGSASYDYDAAYSAPDAAPSYGSAPMSAPSAPGPAMAEPRRVDKPHPFSRISEFIEELRERKSEKQDEFDTSETGSMPPVVTSAQEAMAPAASYGLRDWLDALDEPFSTTLLALIDARGLTDSQVYKRANMSRQLFSKIRSDANYRPTKKTVLALAVALELDLDETADLLQRAGFALSNSSKADVIIEYFIAHGEHDIFAINEALYAFDQPLL